jgi:hypothetical protein
MRRGVALAERDIYFIDAGVSGGVFRSHGLHLVPDNVLTMCPEQSVSYLSSTTTKARSFSSSAFLIGIEQVLNL